MKNSHCFESSSFFKIFFKCYTKILMNVISVNHLKRYFQVFQKKEGLLPSFLSIFKRSYQEVKAVDNLSFRIGEGELVGFIGPNGAGKTTTLKCLSGLLFPSAGEVNVLGFKPYDRKSEFLKQVSLVMGQKNQLWWDLPAIETFRLHKAIYEIPDGNYQEHLKELAQLLDVEKLISTPVRQLSLGQRMKMELIASLIHKPKVLFLDEPTIGLDIVMQKKMRDFISQYNKKYRATILLTSHYMADVEELCRRIIIIDAGKLIYDGSLDNLMKRYADYKIITLHFIGKIDGKKLSYFGKIKFISDNQAVLQIPQGQAKKVVVQLLDSFNITDLTVEKPELEDIISIIFNKNVKL